MLPIEFGTLNNGGSVGSAGGWIVIAAATDNLILAIDIKTGKTVWSDVLPAGGAGDAVALPDGRKRISSHNRAATISW
ncbi:PQQ-dependent dehydrogenase domain-containing protein [Rhizobium gallicum bv. gallicum R602sp]|uniref:PQQ-dependent dehydrogenase domain-containing protein n=1 Tax=Rhizobium gallicum bv. gallicum R602sp TaxID=1041138 RepID=A0A0B4X657_9HYPH|nr:PQQ-dependent dehydrogenase domain-containing protein [Rhizobium gallicum bv. gallicum R602sp]